ncbi:zinc ribbon domain-containing protein [Nitrosopumilus sp.]|nr:zinc ribbon domain-containing protein [Nitrosopumilus sp.]
MNILLKMKVGDPYRLEHIKLMLKQKRTVYGSDRAYLDHLIHDYIEEVKTQKKLSKLRGEDQFEEPSETTTEKNIEDDGGEEELVELEHIYCWKCGKSIPVNSKFCLDCGSDIKKPEVKENTKLNLDTNNISKNNPFCNNCGNKILENTQFCTECGNSLNNSSQTNSSTQSQHLMQGGKPSAAWYLLPIFFSVIGGIISWACIRDRDPRMAKNNLVLGILLTVIPIIIGVVLALGLISLGSFSEGTIDSGMGDDASQVIADGLTGLSDLTTDNLNSMLDDEETLSNEIVDTISFTSKCGAGTVFDDTTNTCILEGTQTTSKCGAGTVFDDTTNTCILEGTQTSSKCGAGTVFDDTTNTCLLK